MNGFTHCEILEENLISLAEKEERLFQQDQLYFYPSGLCLYCSMFVVSFASSPIFPHSLCRNHLQIPKFPHDGHVSVMFSQEQEQK